MSNPIENLQQLATTRLGMTAKNIKPLVMLPGNGVQIRDTASEIYQLAAAGKGLFFSSAMVMKITQKDAESLPRLSPLIPASAMSEFEKYARFGKIVGQKQKEDIMSEGIAKAILQCDVAKDTLPHVKGLLNRPMPMLENGRIEILKAGYNATSGYIVAGGSIIESDSLPPR